MIGLTSISEWLARRNGRSRSAPRSICSATCRCSSSAASGGLDSRISMARALTLRLSAATGHTLHCQRLALSLDASMRSSTSSARSRDARSRRALSAPPSAPVNRVRLVLAATDAWRCRLGGKTQNWRKRECAPPHVQWRTAAETVASLLGLKTWLRARHLPLPGFHSWLFAALCLSQFLPKSGPTRDYFIVPTRIDER